MYSRIYKAYLHVYLLMVYYASTQSTHMFEQKSTFQTTLHVMKKPTTGNAYCTQTNSEQLRAAALLVLFLLLCESLTDKDAGMARILEFYTPYVCIHTLKTHIYVSNSTQ